MLCGLILLYVKVLHHLVFLGKAAIQTWLWLACHNLSEPRAQRWRVAQTTLCRERLSFGMASSLA